MSGSWFSKLLMVTGSFSASLPVIALPSCHRRHRRRRRRSLLTQLPGERHPRGDPWCRGKACERESSGGGEREKGKGWARGGDLLFLGGGWERGQRGVIFLVAWRVPYEAGSRGGACAGGWVGVWGGVGSRWRGSDAASVWILQTDERRAPPSPRSTTATAATAATAAASAAAAAAAATTTTSPAAS